MGFNPADSSGTAEDLFAYLPAFDVVDGELLPRETGAEISASLAAGRPAAD